MPVASRPHAMPPGIACGMACTCCDLTEHQIGLSSDVGRGQEGTAMADRPASDFDMGMRVATANAIQFGQTAVSHLRPSAPLCRGFMS